MKKIFIPVLFLGLFSCGQKECNEEELKAKIDTLTEKAKYYEIIYVETLNAHYEVELATRRAGMPPPPPPAPAYWPPVKK